MSSYEGLCPDCQQVECDDSCTPAPVAGDAVWSDEAAHAFRSAADAVGAHWHSWPDRFRAGMKAALAQGRASQAGAPSASAGVEGPLSVFSAGEWRYSETGQTFSAKDLDEAAFVVYRASQAAAPVGVPDGWVLVPMEPPQHALDYLKVPAVGNWHGMLALMPVAPRSAALRTGGGADHG